MEESEVKVVIKKSNQSHGHLPQNCCICERRLHDKKPCKAPQCSLVKTGPRFEKRLCHRHCWEKVKNFVETEKKVNPILCVKI